MNNVILFDLETTGLLKPEAIDPKQQPYIIEIAMVRGDDVFASFVKPPVHISDEIQKITGITDEMVKDAPSFTKLYPAIAEFCLGADTFSAHNLAFDKWVLRIELQRISKEFNFPWPIKDYCTVEQSMKRLGFRMGLGELYKQITGKDHFGAHRALADVRALESVYNWLMDQKPAA